MWLRTVGILGGVAVGIALLVAYHDQVHPTRQSCGVEPSSAEEVMVVAASGRSWDVRPDVAFDPEAYGAHTSLLEVVIPAGERPLRVATASTHDIVLNLKGDLSRVAEFRSYHDKNRVAVVGLGAKKISFLQKPACRDLLLRSVGDNAHVNVVKVEWPKDPPKETSCVAFDCFATPLSWPREIRLPQIIKVDPARAVASAPLSKPDLLSGYAGLSQLVQRGLLRPPHPGEAEAALDAVRAKYVSRFSLDWRPHFGIDYVMTAPTPLPKKDDWSGSAFRAATILVPSSITVTRVEAHCLVAMGPVAPRSSHEYGLTKLHQPPPYVIAASSNQKCLGEDQNAGPPLFESADQASAVPIAQCRALDVPAGASVIGVYDYRGVRSRPRDADRPIVDLRLEGARPVVLVGRTSNTPRRWRVHEAYPGQVKALLLAEPVHNQWPVQVDGLRPEQVVVEPARLSEWRKSDDPLAALAWRSANLFDGCNDQLSLMSLNPKSPSASVNERGFDLTVKVWTGRPMDDLHYVSTDQQIFILIK